MIAAPEAGQSTILLAALAELSQYLMKDGFADKLRRATSPRSVIEPLTKLLRKAEEVAGWNLQIKVETSAVTACTTGIVHTYMAQEALQKLLLKWVLYCWNQWCQGRLNTTAEDIKNAKAVIIAADKAVETDRFDGKPLINQSSRDGIRKTWRTDQFAFSGKAEIYY